MSIPPQVEDYVLWKNPKISGALLASALVLLISFRYLSLLSVISVSALLVLTVVGAYRFYLAVIFRIKGIHDETFEKISSKDIRISKEHVNRLAHFLENDFNQILEKMKSIILWDNVIASAFAFFAFYMVWCIGDIFDTITLITLVLVSVFTLPKIYQVYKKPIDDAMQKTCNCVHNIAKQVQEKLPFLKKKKN